MRDRKLIFSDLEKATQVADLKKLLEELNVLLEQEPGDTVLLEHRAALFEKLQQYGHAINDYKKILSVNPQHKQASAKIELLQTILRYSNTDIYASTNTNMDPWLE